MPKIFTTVRAGLSTNSWVGTSCKLHLFSCTVLNINDHNDQLTLLSGVFCVDQVTALKPTKGKKGILVHDVYILQWVNDNID